MADVLPTAGASVGRDGYLFSPEPAGEAGAACVAAWRAAIEERRRACRAAGAPYHLMIVPPREAIYADKLADGGAIRAAPPPSQALADLVLDPGPGLRARRRIAETYLRTGSGWTDYGGYAASRDLIEALRSEVDVAPLSEAALEFWEEEAIGDLAASRGGWPPEPETALRVLHAGQGGFRRVFGRSDQDGGGVQAFEHQDASMPRALAFAARGLAAESLARMLPFLCCRFSRLVAVTSPDLFLDLLDGEQPDAVFKLAGEAELAEPPARMRRDFEAWSGLRLPLPAAAPAVAVEFGAGGGAGPLLRDGWSRPEPGRRWSLGAASTLVVAGPLPPGAHELSIELSPCVFPPAFPRQRLAIEANGAAVGAFELGAPAGIRVELPASVVAAAPELTLRFLHPDFVVPAATGRNPDDRPLAFCFERLELRRTRG